LIIALVFCGHFAFNGAYYVLILGATTAKRLYNHQSATTGRGFMAIKARSLIAALQMKRCNYGQSHADACAESDAGRADI
jgi:hypothetical protein